MSDDRTDGAAFKKVTRLLKQYQACVVERTLMTDNYDNTRAVRIGKNLITAVEQLPECLVHFADGGLQRMGNPHVVFSKTDLSAVLIDKSQLNLKVLEPRQTRLVALPLVEKLEPLRSFEARE